jgi:hypothetical protein
VPLRVFFKARAEGVRKTLTVVVNVTRDPVLLPLISPRVRVVPFQVASHTSQSPGVLLSMAIVTTAPVVTPEAKV